MEEALKMRKRSRRQADEIARRRAEIGGRIKALRECFGGNQGALAAKLGAKGYTTISAWESGQNIPSSEMYVQLGNLAAELKLYPQAIWFWQEAGVNKARMFSTVHTILREQRAPARAGEIVRVSPMPEIDPSATGNMPFPHWMIPNHAETFYVRIADDFMRPEYRQGDVLAIDTSETDLWKLENFRVALYRSGDYFEKEAQKQRQERARLQASLTEEERERRRAAGDWPYESLGLLVGRLRRWQGPAMHQFMLEWKPSCLATTQSVASVLTDVDPSNRKLIFASGLRMLGHVVARMDSDLEARDVRERRLE